jgi:hypothetical protein
MSIAANTSGTNQYNARISEAGTEPFKFLWKRITAAVATAVRTKPL